MANVNNDKRIINFLNYPIAFLSVVVMFVYFASLIMDNNDSFGLLLSVLCSTLVGGFFGYFVFSTTKESICFVSGFLCLNLFYYVFSKSNLSFFVIIIIAFALSYLLREFDYKKVFFATLLICCVLGISFCLLNEPFSKLLLWLADKVKNSTFAFGVINEIGSVLFSDVFSDMFYYKDFGGSEIIENKLVSGSINLFEASRDIPVSFVSKFLTGKYFANIFLPIGLFLSLFSKVRDRYIISFSATILVSVFLGNNVLLSLFLIFYNPFIYIAYVLCVGLDYLLCTLLDIRIGFVNSASVFEMIRFIQKPIYLILGGLISALLMYFAVQLVLSKYDLDNHRFLPKNVRKIIAYLGGEKNIVELQEGIVVVKNPNLIDILRLDCIIKENAITLNEEDYDILKKYLE